ncbi:hypothetical protein Hanom_Chr07g00665901 [Helianthus anomalus]
MFYAGTLEKLKNKQAAKIKNPEAANMEDSVKSEKKQVDSGYQETTEQDKATELSRNDEVKPDESVKMEKKQVEKIPALMVEKNPDDKQNKFQGEDIPAFRIENEADDKKMSETCSNCDKFGAYNVKLLKDVESLTLENKILKENEKKF